MADRRFHESGRDGRSVLGMLAVQVERDPKTGTTLIRSVAPVSTAADAPNAIALFDDGRKTIHAIGGSGSQPSTAELGQILSIIDGVGMKVLLDDIVDTNKMEKTDTRRTPEEKCFSPSHATSEEENAWIDGSRSRELEPDNCVGHMDNRSLVVVRQAAVEEGNVEERRLEDIPVTLKFLGYTAGEGHSQDDHERTLRVERVIITEEGEECLLDPETSTTEKMTEWGKGKGHEFQNVSLDGNGAALGSVQGQDGDEELQESPTVSLADGGSTSEHNSCQCCSIM